MKRLKLYIFWLLHQTTTELPSKLPLNCCISFDSYIKPQQSYYLSYSHYVVYLLTPTSNHNCALRKDLAQSLYIFWLLHQTTTSNPREWNNKSCISFDSYIKPQPIGEYGVQSLRCISFDSYIKPQLAFRSLIYLHVVYLLTPTSNHNPSILRYCDTLLYIFWLLHQTTTAYFFTEKIARLYIFWLLHQTTTARNRTHFRHRLYIFWLLHQTTTLRTVIYHKHELYIFWLLHQTTTYDRNGNVKAKLYIFWLLHQTTTVAPYSKKALKLYIFWLLHQTTTRKRHVLNIRRCISFDSYIKPQLDRQNLCSLYVVYLLTPTSNHNYGSISRRHFLLYIFWLLHQTTTPAPLWWSCGLLYIFWLLHQTTTERKS